MEQNVKSIFNLFYDWSIGRHKETNHFYDTNLPYSYHIDLVIKTANQFRHLIPSKIGLNVISCMCAGHDLIEDARVSYNDIVQYYTKISKSEDTAIKVAEAIRAVTNYGRGRDRDERMPDYIYKEIADTPGATFIKLCDRIANCKHGLISGSSMKKKYLKEQPHFKEMLYTEEYKEMWDYLDKLLTLEI